MRKFTVILLLCILPPTAASAPVSFIDIESYSFITTLLLATTIIITAFIFRAYKQSEKKLKVALLQKKTERDMFESAGFAVWEWDIKADTIKAPQLYNELFGYEDNTQRGRLAWWGRIHQEDRPRLAKILNEHLANDSAEFTATFRYHRPQEKTYRWFSAYGKVTHRNTKGEAIHFIGMNKDISQEKETQDILEKSHKRLEHALSAADAGLWELDAMTQKMVTNDLWAIMLGYSPIEFRKQHQDSAESLFALVHPSDKAKVDKCLRELLAGITHHFHCEFRIKKADGEWLWVLGVGKPIIQDECGLPIKILGLCINIQEVKSLQFRLEEAYKAAETKAKEHEALINAIPGIVFTIKLGEKPEIQYVSEQVYELMGYKPAEFIGKGIDHLANFTHPAEIEEFKQVVSNSINEKQSYSMEYRLVTKAGKIRNVYGRGLAVYDEQGTAQTLYGTVLDVTDRKTAEKRTRAILETAPDSMLVVNNRREILLINEQTEKLFGYKSAELLNQPIEILLPKRYKEHHPEYMKTFFTKPTVRQMGSGKELWASRKDGTEFPVEISLSPLQTDDGLYVSAAVRDITERKLADKELLKAKETAEAATKAKSDFLANMSHEIRTPMNAIIGMSHLALKTDLNHKQKNYIEKVNKSAEDLLGIINDILDFSKIEAGKLDIEHVDFDLKSALEQFNNLVGMRAAEKDLELLVQVKEGVPYGLVGDPMRLGQILTNLGGNAVKFTEHGEVVLMIEVVSKQDNNVELKFSITDTGIGMNNEQKGKLFQSFSQADTSTTREYGGTGLGLAISKKLTELMGGEIGVSSVIGEGSCFFFTARFEISECISQDKMLLPNYMNKLKVLIVDDNSHAREILSNIISSLGFEADTYENGHRALEQVKVQDAQGQPYRLAIVDWIMPDMNGITLTQKIQTDKDISSQPDVIMATSYDKGELHGAADLAGIELQGIVTKPLTPSNIFNSIIQALGHEHDDQSDVQLEHNEQKLAAASLSGAKILLVEDNVLNQELATELLQNNNMQVTLAENGAVALEILSQQQFDGVLMDCQMPVLDGYQATKAIRKEDQYKDLPIIAMTANVMNQDIEKAAKSGMNDHIGKPLDVTHMFRTMAKWITPSEKVDTLIKAPDKTSVSDLRFNNIEGINTQAGLKRTQNNTQLYLKLLTRFSEGMENFEQQFIQAEDLTSAKRIAHTLKGNAGNIGAELVQQAAEILEHSCEESNSPESREEYLQKVLGQLLPVLESINQLLVLEKPITARENTLDESDVTEQLQKIRLLVEEYNTEAVNLMEQLIPQIAGTSMQKTLRNVAKSISEYDFDKALTQLNKIMQ